MNLLLDEGATVLTFGRDDDALQDALAEFGGRAGTVYGMNADAATRDGVASVFAEVDDRLGGAPARSARRRAPERSTSVSVIRREG